MPVFRCLLAVAPMQSLTWWLCPTRLTDHLPRNRGLYWATFNDVLDHHKTAVKRMQQARAQGRPAAMRDTPQRLVDLSNQVDAHWDRSEPLGDDQLDALLAEAGQAEETWREAFRASIIEGRHRPS